MSESEAFSEPVPKPGTIVTEAEPQLEPVRPAIADLRGRVAVVTGGGWNIGRAVALRLSRAGARVVIVSRNRTNLEETVGIAKELGVEMRCFVADLIVPDQVDELFADVAVSEGHVHILVCLAGGFGASQPLADTDPVEWLDVLKRNLYATYLCCRRVLPAMIERQKGDILTCAGGGAFFPLVGVHASAYAAAKAGVCRFTDQLYAEVLDYPGIRINCIEPGMTLSPRDLERIAEEEKRTGCVNPVRERNHLPEDGADLAYFLLTPAARGLNGRILAVDEEWWRVPERVKAVIPTDLYRLRRTFEVE